ncbi:glycerol-3-phosphate phosphatase-like protein [Patellaria atrata CBS 101060]|uniref:Glycerol-3-phosphate phosphatase-like protein n=1 Tax=Patellaria atrata CBS 101060 TaxID=1346257 RepID=A0A9P4VW75_9PEZI|nr:glycerol-3-phosphate phosphatase-like protein [Patellaria atrata CBS 101060]
MSIIEQKPRFEAPAVVHSFSGLLFDMDGTIIDSTNAIIKYWSRIGNQIGIDPDVILATSHGRRSIDVLGLHDPKLANWDYVKYQEGLIPKEFGADAVELPGSRSLLNQLEEAGAPWAIVTSGTTSLVTGWLDILKLAHPKHLVSAEDVPRGKPDPACYLLGKKKLNLPDDGEVLVFEDAPSGIKAGKAAGFKVVAVATSHAIESLKEAGADWILRDLSSVTMTEWDSKTQEVRIEIRNALIT